MLLSDRDILAAVRSGRIGIDPFDPDLVTPAEAVGGVLQPASVDVRLDRHFRVLTAGPEPLDPAEPSDEFFKPVTVQDGVPLLLGPGGCVLGATFEELALPRDLTGYVHGKSSNGRLFLLVHATAGLLDAGWSGHVTLEIKNLTQRPVRLWPGMRIAQITYEVMSSAAAVPYGEGALGSRYQSQARGPVVSRSWQRFQHGLPTAAPR